MVADSLTQDSPPVFRAPYYYYSRTCKGLQYSIYCRRLNDGPEEILLDQNKMTHEYNSLGSYEISPNHEILAYSLDLDGSECYNICCIYFILDFKNLATGNIIATIEQTGGDIEWFQDSNTVLYNMLDEIHRSFKVFRFTINNGEKVEVYHETDEKFMVF